MRGAFGLNVSCCRLNSGIRRRTMSRLFQFVGDPLLRQLASRPGMEGPSLEGGPLRGSLPTCRPVSSIVRRHTVPSLAVKPQYRKVATGKSLGGEGERSGRHYFLRSQFVVPPTRACERTTQLDFLFETSCSFSRRLFHHPPVRWEISPRTGSPKMTLYSPTGSARSPLHAEPTHICHGSV